MHREDGAYARTLGTYERKSRWRRTGGRGSVNREQRTHVRPHARAYVCAYARAYGGETQDAREVDDQGWSGLIHAANASQYCLRAALAARALAQTSDVNLRTTGAQPPQQAALHFACSGSDTSFQRVYVVEALLEARAQLEAATPTGATPLLFAASAGLTDVCALLLKSGADMFAKNKNGKGALQLACRNSTSVRFLLEAWGCRETHGEKRSITAGAPSMGKQSRYFESLVDQSSRWYRRSLEDQRYCKSLRTY